MAQTKAATQPEPKAKEPVAKQIKFVEAIVVDGNTSPQSSVRDDEYKLKLMPNGWVSVSYKRTDGTPTLVPSSNIIYIKVAE